LDFIVKTAARQPYYKPVLQYFFMKCAIAFFLLLSSILSASAGITDCPAGYYFDPHSGVGCMQKDCTTVSHAFYDYGGNCVCYACGEVGCSGDINFSKMCRRAGDDASCPSCTYKCINPKELCPGEAASQSAAQPTGGDNIPATGEPQKGILDNIIVTIQDALNPEKQESSTTTTTLFTGMLSNGSWIDPNNVIFGLKENTGPNHPLPNHPLIGVAEAPGTSCPQGSWLLVDTSWREDSRKKCILTKADQMQQMKNLGLINRILSELSAFAHNFMSADDPCAAYQNQCDYTVSHTWQCSTSNEIRNTEQLKHSDRDCANYA
jgi:hypothetical protein